MSDLISRQAAIDALAKNMPTPATPDGAGEFDHEIHIADEAFADAIRIIESIKPAEDVISKADMITMLEETEKELVKGTDEKSIARCFIVSIMGIVKCKIMQMGEKIDG
jgi:hypothetical protein